MSIGKYFKKFFGIGERRNGIVDGRDVKVRIVCVCVCARVNVCMCVFRIRELY